MDAPKKKNRPYTHCAKGRWIFRTYSCSQLCQMFWTLSETAGFMLWGLYGAVCVYLEPY